MRKTIYMWIRSQWILIIGLIFIIGAVALEGGGFDRSYNFEIIEEEGNIVHRVIPSDKMFLWKSDTWISVLKELGFACLIAFSAAWAIDKAAREEFRAEVDEKIQQVQDNVFLATFGRDVNRKVIDELDELVLRSDFSRTEYRADYSLSIIGDDSLPDSLKGRLFYLLESTTIYRIKNISGSKKVFPLKMSLEYPVFSGLEVYTDIKSVKVNSIELTEPERKKADASAEDSVDFKYFKYNRELEPGQSLLVETVMTTVKFPNDNEIWRSIYPSDRMSLTVRVPETVRTCRAHSLHRSDVVDEAGADGRSVFRWRLDEGILPHQGIVFWWVSDDLPLRQGHSDVA